MLPSDVGVGVAQTIPTSVRSTSVSPASSKARLRRARWLASAQQGKSACDPSYRFGLSGDAESRGLLARRIAVNHAKSASRGVVDRWCERRNGNDGVELRRGGGVKQPGKQRVGCCLQYWHGDRRAGSDAAAGGLSEARTAQVWRSCVEVDRDDGDGIAKSSDRRSGIHDDRDPPLRGRGRGEPRRGLRVPGAAGAIKAMRDAREPVAGSGHRPRGDGPPERRSAHPFC